MSKRNFILLIIVLLTATALAFGFFYLQQPNNKTETGEVINFFADFFPFGKSKTTTPTETTSPADVSGFVPETETEIQNTKLRKVSTFPIAGFGIFSKERFKDILATPIEQIDERGKVIKPSAPPTEFMPALRYINKATGHIYQTFVDKIDQRKFSSTTIPKVYEGFLGNRGESMVARYLKADGKTIETFVGSLPREYLGADSAGRDEITGSFLPENISDVSISADSLKMFYLFTSAESAIGTILSLENNTKIQVFDSPFTEWLSFWPNNKTITMTTKPSFNTPGYMYIINPEKKDFKKALGGINGLTTLTSPDGKIVLYADNNLSLYTFNLENGNSNLLSLKTLPEKCVWGKESDIVYCAVPKNIERLQYPDSWYQGEVSFSDEIWGINIQNGNTTILSDPADNPDGWEEIDGIKLALDENQNYLLFINKKDSYLWRLELK